MGESSDGVRVVFPVSPVVWRVRLCRQFLAGRIFDHGECVRVVYAPLILL